MEYTIIDRSYAFRSERCYACERSLAASVSIKDVLIPAQKDLGIDMLEMVVKIHSVCVEDFEKRYKR